MANGYWIKMRVSLPSDPRVIEMATHLAHNEYFMSWIAEPVRMTCKESALEIVTPTVTRCVTVTGLLLVWGVASECGKRAGECDMRLDYANLYTIDEISGVPGFGEAMESVGWIKERDKHLIFPNFCEDNVIHEDRATAQARERKRRQRERQKEERDIKRDSHAKSHARGEESREECKDPPNPPKGGKRLRPREQEKQDRIALEEKARYELNKRTFERLEAQKAKTRDIPRADARVGTGDTPGHAGSGGGGGGGDHAGTEGTGERPAALAG